MTDSIVLRNGSRVVVPLRFIDILGRPYSPLEGKLISSNDAIATVSLDGGGVMAVITGHNTGQALLSFTPDNAVAELAQLTVFVTDVYEEPTRVVFDLGRVVFETSQDKPKDDGNRSKDSNRSKSPKQS